jgi:nucleoside-diphosphate-sugar epimerase
MSLGRSDVFNVAGEETVSIRGLIGVIEDVLGVEAVIRQTEGEQEDLVGANEKMKDVLGVTPQVSLAEGIRSMVE